MLGFELNFATAEIKRIYADQGKSDWKVREYDDCRELIADRDVDTVKQYQEISLKSI